MTSRLPVQPDQRKQCVICGEILSLEEFYKPKSHHKTRGREKVCRSCHFARKTEPAESCQKFYQTTSFKALNQEWKAKLKDSGFEDIEQDEQNLKEYASSDFKKRPDYDKSKEEYYRLAGQFLHQHPSPFRTSKSGTGDWKRRIWELHAEGKSIRDIVKILDPDGKEPPGRLFKQIQPVLAHLAKVMVKQCLKQISPQ